MFLGDPVSGTRTLQNELYLVITSLRAKCWVNSMRAGCCVSDGFLRNKDECMFDRQILLAKLT